MKQQVDHRPSNGSSSNRRKSADGVRALDRGLLILETLAQEDEGLSIGRLVETLKLPAATVHRLLQTLCSRGYVEQDAESRKYRIGIKILQLKSVVLGQKRFAEVAMPVMKELARVTGEMVHLVVMNSGEVVYVNTVESFESPGKYTQIGMRAPCHCTSVGKAMLAFMDEEEVERILREKGLPRRTPKTITSEAALKHELDLVRSRGFAVDDEEAHVGNRCVGAPIRDYTGKVIAAISVSGPSARVRPERDQELGALVMDAARRISHGLGYAGDRQEPRDGAKVAGRVGMIGQ